MADREKVIKGVEHCFHGQECCGDIECPYYIEHLSDSCCLEDCQENLKEDVIALLKAQKTANVYKCPNCGTWVSAENVVRCKDCIAAHDGELIYEMWCGITGKRIMRDDFCSNGRRKDE